MHTFREKKSKYFIPHSQYFAGVLLRLNMMHHRHSMWCVTVCVKMILPRCNQKKITSQCNRPVCDIYMNICIWNAEKNSNTTQMEIERQNDAPRTFRQLLGLKQKKHPLFTLLFLDLVSRECEFTWFVLILGRENRFYSPIFFI